MESATVHPKRTLVIRIALAVLAALAVAALVALGFRVSDGYRKIRGELNELNTSVTALRTQNDELQTKSDEFEKKLNLQQNDSTEQVVTYSVTTGKHARQPSNPYQDVGTDTLFLEVSIKNTSKLQGFISPSVMKLKDDQNHTYMAFSSYPTSGYPSGLPKLEAQALTPGETVAGALVFTVPKSVKSFTLIYGSLEVAVEAQ